MFLGEKLLTCKCLSVLCLSSFDSNSTKAVSLLVFVKFLRNFLASYCVLKQSLEEK